MKTTLILDPAGALTITTFAMALSILVVFILYYALKSRRVRTSTLYLSGEPENVVSTPTPSIASMYWGFMKRFAKSLYRILVEEVHTGSLHDWARFISSWLAILIILAIIIFIVFVLMG